MELAFLSNIYWQRSVFIITFQVSLLDAEIPVVLDECNTPWPQWQKQLISRLNRSGRGVAAGSITH